MGADLRPDDLVRRELDGAKRSRNGFDPEWSSGPTSSIPRDPANDLDAGDQGWKNQAGFAAWFKRRISPLRGVGESSPYGEQIHGKAKPKGPLDAVHHLEKQLFGDLVWQGDARYQAVVADSMSPKALAANLAVLGKEAAELITDHPLATLSMFAVRAAMQVGANRAATKGYPGAKVLLAGADLALLLGPLGPHVAKWREAVQLAATTTDPKQAAEALSDAQRNYAKVFATAGATAVRFWPRQKSVQARAPIDVTPGKSRIALPAAVNSVAANQVVPLTQRWPQVMKEFVRFFSLTYPVTSLATEAASNLGRSVFFSDSHQMDSGNAKAGGEPPGPRHSWKNDDFVRMSPSFFEAVTKFRGDSGGMDPEAKASRIREIIWQELSAHNVERGVEIKFYKKSSGKYLPGQWEMHLPTELTDHEIIDWSQVCMGLATYISRIVEDWNLLVYSTRDLRYHELEQFVSDNFPPQIVLAAKNAKANSQTISPERVQLFLDALIIESNVKDFIPSPRQVEAGKAAEKAIRTRVDKAGQWASDHQGFRAPPGALQIEDNFFDDMHDVRKKWKKLRDKERAEAVVGALNHQLKRQGVHPLTPDLVNNGFFPERWSIGVPSDLISDDALPDEDWHDLHALLAFYGAAACEYWQSLCYQIQQDPFVASEELVTFDGLELPSELVKAAQRRDQLTPAERARAELILESTHSEESRQLDETLQNANAVLMGAEAAMETVRLETSFLIDTLRSAGKHLDKTNDELERQLRKVTEAYEARTVAYSQYEVALRAAKSRPEGAWADMLAGMVMSRARRYKPN